MTDKIIINKEKEKLKAKEQKQPTPKGDLDDFIFDKRYSKMVSER